MDDKQKKIVFFLGGLLVAVIFLTSYLAFGNNNGSNTSSTTTSIKAVQTVFAVGKATGTITNYSYIANVTLRNTSNSSKTEVTSIISKFVQNGTVENYVYSRGTFELFLSNISAYDLQEVLYQDLNSSNSVMVSAPAFVTLPQNVSLYYSNSSPSVNVYLTNRNYTIYVNNDLKSIGSTINLDLSALITAQGTIYNNQLQLKVGDYTTSTTSTSTSSTSTIAANGTVQGYATMNGIIANYSAVANVTPYNRSNASEIKIENLIGKFIANKTVSKYTATNGSFFVALANISAYGFQEALYKNLNSTNSIRVGSPANIILPQNITLHAVNNASKSVTVFLTNRNYTLYLINLQKIGSTVKLNASGNLTNQSKLLNNQMQIKQAS